MRINVYSQELTDEVVRIEKASNTGRPYVAAQLILHSSPMLHHPPDDDDRSAVTFWLPSSISRRESMARAFERIAAVFRAETQRSSHANGSDRAAEAIRILRRLCELNAAGRPIGKTWGEAEALITDLEERP